MPGLLFDTLRGTNGSRRPVWLMRQAGRYLPEYRELRARKGGFLPLVYDSEAAAEITLQPLRRFGFDGAILFSDILIVPYAMGQDLEFLAGEGPRMSPRLVDHALSALESVPERLSPIYETVRLVRAALTPEQTMLGFAGSPWTIATYMVAGEGSRDQHETRAYAYRDRGAFQAIIDAVVATTVDYLEGQVIVIPAHFTRCHGPSPCTRIHSLSDFLSRTPQKPCHAACPLRLYRAGSSRAADRHA